MGNLTNNQIPSSIVSNSLLSDRTLNLLGLIALFSFVIYSHRKFTSLNNKIKRKIADIGKRDFLSYLKISFAEDLTKRRNIMIFSSWVSIVFTVFLLFQIATVVFGSQNGEVSIGLIFISIAGSVIAFIFESSLNMEELDRTIKYKKFKDITKDEKILNSINNLNKRWRYIDDKLKEKIANSIIELILEKAEEKNK